MFGEICEYWLKLVLPRFLTCLLTGLAVKLMDDYLDAPCDRIAGRYTLACLWGRATLCYALVAFSLAVVTQAAWALSLFWASYVLGMGGDMRRSLPLGLSGWQESVLLSIVAVIALGWREVVTSFLAIFVVQAGDDLLDKGRDEKTGGRNLAVRWGRGETALVAVTAALACSFLDGMKLGMVLIAAPLISFVLRVTVTGRESADGVSMD